MMEAERAFRFVPERGKIFARGFQKGIGSDDIGLNEFAGAVDRTVDVRFRGEMHDVRRLEFGENAIHRRTVADVRFFKTETRIGGNFREIFQISRIGELIHDAK